MEDKLQQLLRDKSFDDLSSNEKEHVLESIDKVEYDQIHFLLKKTKSAYMQGLSNVNPNIKTRDELKRVFKRWHYKSLNQEISSTKRENGKVLSGKLVMYTSVVIAILILFLSVDFFIKKTYEVQTTAMDIDKIEGFDEMNRYLYFDETCLDAGLVIPNPQ